MNKITRYYDVEMRSLQDENNVVEGMAAVFNQEADLGWFTEIIDRSAFDGADLSDVVLNLNHNNDFLLAGTRNGSLQLQVRDNGVFQTSRIIDTTQGEDALKLVRSGLISKMSFAFTIADGGEDWETRDGKEYRRITKIDKVYDVSLVTFPAYSQTSVWSRSNDALAEQHKALMERRAEQDKKMEDLINGKNLIK